MRAWMRLMEKLCQLLSGSDDQSNGFYLPTYVTRIIQSLYYGTLPLVAALTPGCIHWSNPSNRSRQAFQWVSRPRGNIHIFKCGFICNLYNICILYFILYPFFFLMSIIQCICYQNRCRDGKVSDICLNNRKLLSIRLREFWKKKLFTYLPM
jgi:hypothetical protein